MHMLGQPGKHVSTSLIGVENYEGKKIDLSEMKEAIKLQKTAYIITNITSNQYRFSAFWLRSKV